jgi:AAA15 family ATPase/GTPase
MLSLSQSFTLDQPGFSVENGEHLMIERVSVENFRCFQSLEIKGLKRVSVIVGKNSSGKSAFMESLFLSSSSTAPANAFQMRAIRKAGAGYQVPGDELALKSIWEDLFFDFDSENRIHIQLRGTEGDQRQLSIGFSERTTQGTSSGKALVNATAFPQIVFTWKRGGGRDIVVKPTVTATGLDLHNAPVDFFPMIWFHANSSDTPDVTARRYSELSKRNRAQPIVDAVRGEFDFIENLSIEFHSGLPMIFAAVKGKSQKMPIGLVSDGVQRLITLLLGIAYYKDGVVLIDQLEDGFYFEHFPSIWKVIYSFSVTYNVQLFVSTHSDECLNAVHDTLKANSGDFQLLRAERNDNTCSISQFDGDTFLSGIKQKVPFR